MRRLESRVAAYSSRQLCCLCLKEMDDEGNVTGNSTADPAPTLSQFLLIKSIVLCFLAVTSLIGNVITLVSIARLRKNSTVYFFVSHLALADVFVSIFCLTVEAAWTYTVQWYGGNFLCKLLKFFQMFSLYLSTFVLILIAMDRYTVIRYPMSITTAKRRCRTWITLVWLLSCILSIPQLLIFKVQRGPFREEFYQCVTYGSYTEVWQEQLYSTFSFISMFVIPLLTLIVAYVCIFCSISSSEKSFRSEESNVSHVAIVRRKIMQKAKFKSLKLTMVIVFAFVVCWTPYYLVMIASVFPDWNVVLSERVVAFVFFFGMSNSLVNPLIYGAFHLRHSKRRRRRDSYKQTSVSQTMVANSAYSFRRNTSHRLIDSVQQNCSFIKEKAHVDMWTANCTSKNTTSPKDDCSGHASNPYGKPSVVVTSF